MSDPREEDIDLNSNDDDLSLDFPAFDDDFAASGELVDADPLDLDMDLDLDLNSIDAEGSAESEFPELGGSFESDDAFLDSGNSGSVDDVDLGDFSDFSGSGDAFEPVGILGEPLGGQDIEETVLGGAAVPSGIVEEPEEEDGKKKKKKKEKAPKVKKEKPPKEKKEKAHKVKKEKPPKVPKEKKEKPLKVKKEKVPKTPRVPGDSDTAGLQLPGMIAMGCCALLLVIFLIANALVFLNGGLDGTNMMFLISMDLIAVIVVAVPFLIYKARGEVSLFEVGLGVALVAVSIGAILLLAEWKNYKFTINKAKTVSSVLIPEDFQKFEG